MTDDLADTLRTIVQRLDELGIAYMVVGSIAALAHGRSRSTQDFDMVIEVDAARLRAFVASLPVGKAASGSRLSGALLAADAAGATTAA